MCHLTACEISVSLSVLNWIKNEMIFYRISELMLATLILRYDKHFLFSSQLKFYRLSGATLYDHMIIYQDIKPFFDNNKPKEDGAFKSCKIPLLFSALFYCSLF